MQPTRKQHPSQAIQRTETPAPVPDPGLAYFKNRSAAFVNSADVLFCIGRKRLPAHSQYLAGECNVWAGRFSDPETQASKSDPLVFTDTEPDLDGIAPASLEAFLGQLYSNCSQRIASATEAHELFLLADRFDCQKLREACFGYLKESAGSFLQASIEDKNSVLKWFLFAEEYSLPDLRKACITFMAKNFDSVETDQRLKQLDAAALLDLVHALQMFRRQERHAPGKRRRRTKSPVYLETSE